jgi:hypothetical protein
MCDCFGIVAQGNVHTPHDDRWLTDPALDKLTLDNVRDVHVK